MFFLRRKKLRFIFFSTFLLFIEVKRKLVFAIYNKLFLNIISSLEIFEKQFGSCGFCDQSVHVILVTGHDKKMNSYKRRQAGQVVTGHNAKNWIFDIFKPGSFKNIF